ncbi:hypothetical protein ACHHYP_10637 [Achlya hypogyna]|uniref:Uncharacterized protein n=1 Tax=Achlya hypogyna TaxID=1202772 RepID=A0A1V9YKV3_ACHHY|nr:hypothetical protein ACHHYP_10637 [Achlya hypogyna]
MSHASDSDNDSVDDFAALLDTDDGVRTLVSYAVAATEDDPDMQANALALLGDNTDVRVAKAVVDSSLLDILLGHVGLNDADDDLHLPIWRCLAGWAVGAPELSAALWAVRSQLVDAAFVLRHKALSTTSLVCTVLVAVASNASRQHHSGLFCGFVQADVTEFCGLLKQLYVFGGNVGVLDLFRHLLTSKAEAKALFASGLPRIWAREWYDRRDSPFSVKWTALLFHLQHVLHPHRAVLYSGSDSDAQWASTFCALALSSFKFVWTELAPMLLDALDNAKSLLVAHPHCAGVIAWFLSRPGALSDAARTTLEAVASELEGANLIELPTLDIGLNLRAGLATATALKESGNRWFAMGNYTAARQFYRLALSTLKVTEATERRRRNAPDAERSFSIGTCVEVRHADGSYLTAMVSDVEDDGKVEVIYDATGDDDVVAAARCRLCLSMAEQSELASLQVALCMNLAKCLAHLRMVAEAIECLGFGLSLLPDHLPALYLRGLLGLQSLQLKQARDDFYRANAVAIERKDKATQVEIHRAWKRLKVLTTQRKKADKKLIKEMMAYLDTIAIDASS